METCEIAFALARYENRTIALGFDLAEVTSQSCSGKRRYTSPMNILLERRKERFIEEALS
jgi:hypothetical protein